MQIKSIAMMAIAGSVIALSTGCVKQEDLDNLQAKLTAEKEAAVAEVQTKLTDAESLLSAEKDRTRTLTADLRDSAALNDELKQSTKELKASLADANSKISSLESQLATMKAQISSAQAQAADAESQRAATEMKAQETQRRFDQLIANLIALNKIKPEDVAWDNLSVEIPQESGAMDMGGSMDDSMGMDDGMGAEKSTGSAADLLDEMGNM